MKELRRNNKTGWLELADNEDMRFIIDAVLETSPNDVITPKSISERSGVKKERADICLEYLYELEALQKESENEYKTNEEVNPVLQELFHLNSAVNSKRGNVRPLSERLEDV